MLYYFHAYSGLLSMLLPTVASLVRFRKAERTFLPFLLLMPLGMLSETASYLVTRNGGTNEVIINFFVLFEALLLTWQFRRWGLFDDKRWHLRFYYLLQSLYIAWWLYESFVLSTLFRVNSYYILFSSLSVVLMSIHLTSEKVFRHYGSLWQDPAYLISNGLLLYFTCALITEIFWLYGLGLSPLFRQHVITAMLVVNLIANLIYTIAIIWIPTKFRYLLPW